jgi:pimeloyl-ACP methyl ester carboxylesterase
MERDTPFEWSRRQFIQRAALTGAAASVIGALNPPASEAAPVQAAAAPTESNPLDLAEWTYFWVGVRRAKLAKGTLASGEQMYVESFVPAQVRHPFSIVLVHGGGGQGLDWTTTPDGRPGWAHYLVREGYRVYVVDRPGHGRSPFHPDLHGPFPARAATFDTISRQFTAPEKAAQPYGPEAKLHTQWPGTTGIVGDPTVDQVMASQGGSFLPDVGTTHRVWAERAGELLDIIGPSVFITHSAGGPFAFIAADARPNLVVGLVPVEPAGPTFGNLTYGVTASPLLFDPPIIDPSELQTVEVKPAEAYRTPYRIQAEPARKLKNLAGIPIALVTSPASYHWPYDQGTVALLKQAGCSVEHIELEKRGITGNGHFLMMERNNRAVLQPVLEFLDKTVAPHAARLNSRPSFVVRRQSSAASQPKTAESLALKLADTGHFWIGVERKEMPYGVISGAPMYVQYLIPETVRFPLPIVLVHGGSGQMLHYMGAGDGTPGWAHYFVQAGYTVYLVDRPGHGRAVYHPDALGSIGPLATYEQLVADFTRSSRGSNPQWRGTGEIGDPLVDQFMASQNATPADAALASSLWTRHGAALVDRLGPSVIMTHSAGGPFGWLVANERPNLVKAVMSFEGQGAPLTQATAAGQTPDPKQSKPLPGLKGLPILYVTAENSNRLQGPAVVESALTSGARAEHVYLKDRGLRGNSHFAMFEKNSRQVWEVFDAWLRHVIS